MNRLIRMYFMLLAVLSMLLLTACGGGSEDGVSGAVNSAENDYNNSNVNSSFVGEWYLYSESGKIVKANDSGKTDLLNLKSNGTLNIVGYYSTEYSNYIQTNNNIEDNTAGTWSYSNGKLYLTSEGETYYTYASLSNNTLTIRHPDTNDSLVYKKANSSTNNNNLTPVIDYADLESYWISDYRINIYGNNFSESGKLEISYIYKNEIKEEIVMSYDDKCDWASSNPNKISYILKNPSYVSNLKNCKIKVIINKSSKELVSNEVELRL